MLVRSLSIVSVLLVPSLVLSEPPAKARLDAHGFPLPDGAIARLGDLHFAQPGPITAMALSPDGKVIATAGHRVIVDPKKPAGIGEGQRERHQMRIFLWDADTGLIVREIVVSSWIWTLAFSS